MRKITVFLLSVVCAAACVFGLTACKAQVDTPTQTPEYLEYTQSEDGQSYSLTKVDTLAKNEVVIKAAYNGKPVTNIATGAFLNCTDVTSIVIPSSVTSIGTEAVKGCTGLQEITVPFAGTSADSGKFSDIFDSVPKSLKTVVLTGGMKVHKKAFMDCGDLENVRLPDSITEIGEDAFNNCKKLTSVNIPSSVKFIGSYAFAKCIKLDTITIPSSVWEIGDFVFYSCGLTSITIPDSVKYIAYHAFDSCYYLESIDIPSSVTHIGRNAFIDCRGLTSVTISSSVKKIEDGTFYGCRNLTKVTIPSSVKVIEIDAFGDCRNLTNIIFNGTKEDWHAIDKKSGSEGAWNSNSGNYTVTCTNGELSKKDSNK